MQALRIAHGEVGNALFLESEDVLAREELFTVASTTSNDRAALLDAFFRIWECVSITFLWYPNRPNEFDNHLRE